MFLPNDMNEAEKAQVATIARRVRGSWPEPVTEENEAKVRARAQEIAAEHLWTQRSEAIAAADGPWWMEESTTGYPPRWVILDSDEWYFQDGDRPIPFEPTIDVPRVLADGNPELLNGSRVFSRLTVREWEMSGRVMPAPDPQDFFEEEARRPDGTVAWTQQVTREAWTAECDEQRWKVVADLMSMVKDGRPAPTPAPEGMRYDSVTDRWYLRGSGPMTDKEMDRHLDDLLAPMGLLGDVVH